MNQRGPMEQAGRLDLLTRRGRRGPMEQAGRLDLPPKREGRGRWGSLARWISGERAAAAPMQKVATGPQKTGICPGRTMAAISILAAIVRVRTTARRIGDSH